MDIAKQRSALDYLWYEIWMLKQTSNKLAQQAQSLFDAQEQLLFNIYLESFLIHARNLIYFLGNKKDSRDIRCSDFGIDALIISLPQGNSVGDIDKFVSHLTCDRLTKEKPKWNVERIREEIKNKKDIFIKQLSDNLFPTPRYGKKKNDFLQE